MIHNLILFIWYKYRDKILLYFTEEAKSNAKDNSWDKTTNRVIFAIDTFLEEELEDDIRLFVAQTYIEDQNKKIKIIYL